MAIDEIERRLTDFLDYIPYDTEEGKKDCEAIEEAIGMIKDCQPIKFDYERRLKADLRAILVELQLQMEEYEPKWVENDEQAVASCRTWEDLDDIIQQKIDALEAETENT